MVFAADSIEDDFVERDFAARGVHESGQFSGLVLDMDALIALDKPNLIEALKK